MTQKRVTMSFPERTVERLEELKDLTAASSTTDVVRSAIMTYESIARHLANGVIFQAVKPNGERTEVEFMIDVPRSQPELKLVQ